MSEIKDGGPAFSTLNIPDMSPPAWSGQSLRDAFAMAALEGLCANPGGPFQQSSQCGWQIVNCTINQVADEAYGLADAMLRAREAS